ncbi:MAG: phosphatase domain-containing protein [Gemmatimonadota bacterium]
MSGPGWARWAARIARAVEQDVDASRARRRTAHARQVVPYRGFGNRREIFVSGRVLGNPPAGPVDAADRWWRNLANAWRHLETDEVAGARVRVRVGGAESEVLTDEEGFYRAWLEPASLESGSTWHDVHVEVVDRVRSEAPVRATGRALVPTRTAEFGVISDLDDTVIRTEATRLLRMLKRTLLENALTRLPFPGVAEFYESLHAGASGSAGNPIFYVSSSPWNLYGVLTDFLQHQSVPPGPLMLRDWGISDRGMLPTAHGDHKLGAIRQIMNCYAGLPFILVGDSGQQDPEIYRDVVHEHGDRVLAVYIRNVTSDPARSHAISALSAEVRLAGSDLLLSDDTLASARHAASHGWIRSDSVERVADAVSSSAARPG